MLQRESDILDFHRKLLGLPKPWEVTDVKLDLQEKRVNIEVIYPKGTVVHCPECNDYCPVKDFNHRVWRHLDTMQFQTFLSCRVPRSDCPHHGALQILVPWSEPNSRFTLLFESFVIELLQVCKSQTQAASFCHLSWKQIHRIQAHAVERGLCKRKLETIRQLGIDEKSFRRGHRYVTILNDLEQKRVLEVTEGRDGDASRLALEAIAQENRGNVESVAMDFLTAYQSATREIFPNADIVHDRFHISSYLGKAVDTVRKSEHRGYLKMGESPLTGSKYLWLTHPYNWSYEQKQTFKSMRTLHLKVGKAHAIKEEFRAFWGYFNKASAHNFFKRWFFWATHSRLLPIAKVAKMLQRHLPNILTYFKHRISNSTAEMLNGKIQAIKADAHGFRNFQNFRTAILFHCGKLDLLPLKRA